jgi:DNA-directed RNA polymerase specialized sigma24 family protein
LPPQELDETRDLVRKALAREPAAVRTLVDLLSPVIERKVAATLWKRTPGRDVRQEVRDMTQAVFLSLFDEDGKALRAWDPARGSPLESFVALLAHRQVISILRRGRTSPWPDEPTEGERLERLVPPALGPEEVIGSREHLTMLLDRIREELSPIGLELFQRLIVDEEPLAEVAAKVHKTEQALYQWRSRLLRQIRTLSAEILGISPSETVQERRIASGTQKGPG